MKEDRDRFWPPASTAISRSHSTCASSPASRRPCSTAREARAMNEPATILVVDDLPQNVRLLEAVLAPRGYTS